MFVVRAFSKPPGGEVESAFGLSEKEPILWFILKSGSFGGHDAGSNLALGLFFLATESDRTTNERKLECKPERSVDMSTLALRFTREDLVGYLGLRTGGLTRASIPWPKKAAGLLWDTTRGFVSMATLRRLRDYVIQKYTDLDAKRKILNFSKAFLRYMSKTTFDSRYAAFDLFLAIPKAVKVRKHVTQRIVTTEDIQNVVETIRNSELPEQHRRNFEALVLFGAYTGQRPYATIRQLTAAQFHSALEMEKPA